MKSVLLFTTLSLGWSLTSTRAASFQGLGDLPGGSFLSYALGVSDGGGVVTGVATSSSGEEAFRWTPAGGLAGLGNTMAGGTGFMVHATKVSRDGTVIGGYGNSPNGIKAVRWQAGTGTFISQIQGGGQSDVRAVSADGSALAGYIYSANGVEAYRWTVAGGMEPLGDLPGGSFLSDAYGVSDDGAVVVGGGNSSGGGVPFRWENGAMEPLAGFPFGGYVGAALAVSSDSSTIVGYHGLPTIGPVAFRWSQSGGLVALGGVGSLAYGVSGNGSVVVGSDVAGAFIWDAARGMRTLRSVLINDYGLSAELNGWILQSAEAISDDGTAIAGYGRNPSGQIEAWVAVLEEPCYEKRLDRLDPAAFDYFGRVAIDGDIAVAAALQDDDGGANTGSVYLFDRNAGGLNQWGRIKKLTAPDAQSGDTFGYTVAISGDTVVVTTGQDDDLGVNSGSGYVFDRNQGGADQWGFVRKIYASDSAPNDEFGVAALHADTLAVGVSSRDDNGENSGAVYIYLRNAGGANQWGEVRKILPADGVPGAYFGGRVSLHGDVLVVGASGRDDAGTDSGVAYVFYRNHGGVENWGQVARLTAFDAAAFSYFGSAAVHGDLVAIGSPGRGESFPDVGAVYLFHRNQGGADQWGFVKKILPDDLPPGAQFGYWLGLNEHTLVAGAATDSTMGFVSGSAYTFSRHRGGTDNWGQVRKITPSDGASPDTFGYCLGLSGSTIVVGAQGKSDCGGSCGAAYIFETACDTEPATPKITWPGPSAIVYGEALSGVQLNATAGVPGTFTYSPAGGTVLNAGAAQTLSVTFTPDDLVNYATASASVIIDVLQATPAITWPSPAAIAYGTELSGVQLNAAANVLGTSTYSPAAGTILNVGTAQPLSVVFSPTDSVNYTTATASVLIEVVKATPVVTWANPPDMTVGNPLGSGQLNATASVSGIFSYSPPAGTVLPVGNAQSITLIFDPDDGENYNSVTQTVLINVLGSAPVGCSKTYDLRRDWSTTENPNSVWTYRAGSQVLPADAWGDSFPSFQPAWKNGSPGSVPAWIYSQIDPVAGLDWRAGDVVVHTQDNNFGFGNGQANVVWTSPADGFVTISGGVWMGRDGGRANVWRLYLRGYQLSSGSIYSGDPFDREHPFEFDAGSGGASVTQYLQVSAGDEVVFGIDRNSTYGDYVGVNLIITLTEPASPTIVEISVPPNSQNSYSRPAYDNVWTVSAPPYPLAVDIGIGIIVNPAIVGGNDNHDFALHQNDGIQPSPLYAAPYVPNPDSATVTYRFDQSAVVAGVEIVQHVFGISRVEGLVGNDLNTMTSLGAVFGPSGDVVDSFVVPAEAQSQVFTFNNTTTAGTYFQLVVRKTAHPSAYANYRIFPLDQHGNRIPIAINCGPSAPTITWPSPSTIVYGEALSGAQLNATADVPGTFVYSPPGGTVLNAGAGQTISVTFTPGDQVNYMTASASVLIDVLQATPAITWPLPAAIVYGTALSDSQLNATADVPGTFAYSPAEDAVLIAGAQQELSVVFTPDDSVNYATASTSIAIDVLKALPTIEWNNPNDIAFGAPLETSVQLNATASVPGTFVYDPPTGTVLLVGNGQILSVLFLPDDATNYEPVAAQVSINVFNPDSDNDGLLDFDEVSIHQTDPLNPDTDGDGLLDGTEVDMAAGGGCPSPLVSDSDNDGLSDGDEVVLGTNPCDSDTDADGVGDLIDPLPTTPGVTIDFLEEWIRDVADNINDLPLAVIMAPNANAKAGRRNALANRAQVAATLVGFGDYAGAITELTSLLEKVDGQSPPPDWMTASPEMTALAQEVVLLIDLIELLSP